MGWIIASVLSGAMFIVSIIANTNNTKVSGEANPANTFVAVLMFVLCIIFFKKYKDSKNGVTERKKIEQRKKAEERIEELKKIPGSKERVAELGASLCINANHMSGLPLAEDTPCHVYLCDDKVIFERNETIYNLPLEKMKDVTIKTDIEIQKAYVSSIGGAVGGAVLFGPLGAMVGGRAKEKKSATTHEYLIFTYDKDDNVDFISFDVTKVFKAHKFVEFFEKIPKEKKEIDL